MQVRQESELYFYQKHWDKIKNDGDFFYLPYIVIKHSDRGLKKEQISPAADIGGLRNTWVSNCYKQFFNELPYCMSIFERIGNLLHPLRDSQLNQERRQVDKV